MAENTEMTTDRLKALIHDVRPGGITAEKLAELTGHPLETVNAELEAMEARGTATHYVASGMRFWRLPR